MAARRRRRAGGLDAGRIVFGSMQKIRIRGARTHNLKNIDLDLPRDQLIVFTGLSGSGKSSLAFDTIYRSEEHTSELQSHLNLVCRLLLEKKKYNQHIIN